MGLLDFIRSSLFYSMCVFINCQYQYPDDPIGLSNNNFIANQSLALRSSRNLFSLNEAENFVKVKVNIKNIPLKSDPIVLTKSGYIEGYVMKTIRKREIYAFEGIPFGEDTGGQSRFKNPISKKPWKNILSAKKPGSRCLQLDPLRLFAILGSEDCLFLNIYTPQISSENSNSSLGVIVFLHGGAWFFGSGMDYGPSYLLDHGRNVILVTINYRLGVFGYLSTHDETLPGNLGQKDQVLALKWVQNNIKAFGGDPKRVTILGHSSGAASVHFHMFSELSKGLFSQGISIGGTAYSTWALMSKSKSDFHNNILSRATGCSLESSTKFIQCLKQIDGRTIVSRFNRFLRRSTIPFVPLGIVIEKESPSAFLSKSPDEAYSQSKVSRYPYLVLKNSEEMAVVEEAVEIFGVKRILNLVNLRSLLSRFAPIIFEYKYNENVDVEKISNYLSDYYFPSKNFTENASHIIFTDMLNDGLFGYGVHKTLETHSKTSPTYSWIYSHKAEFTLSKTYGINKATSGVSHIEDIPLIFNVTSDLFPSFKTSDVDYPIVKFLTSIIFNFASIGDPLFTMDDGEKLHIWDPVNSTSIKVLSIGTREIKMIDEPFQDRYKFWSTLKIS